MGTMMQMDPRRLFEPVVAQALLTLVVWVWMYYQRLTELKRKGIDPQEIADAVRFDAVLGRVVHSSDNLENLFEMPMLFFVGVIVTVLAGQADSLGLGLAWGFVFFRALHSLIHCTYNRITHRFSAYLISSLILWVIWLRLGITLINEG